MEQPTQLTIIRTDTVYRFRLDLPEGQPQPTQEYITEVTPEVRERLRRALKRRHNKCRQSHLQTFDAKQ